MLKKWKKISEETRFSNNWWKYRIDRYLFPDGKSGEYHYVHTNGSVFIIPQTSDGKIIMVRQYRYLNDRFSIEFPGGGVKNSADVENEARKELIEETGFEGDLRKIGIFNPYNGVTDEICHVFIAHNLRQSSEFIKDDSEEFELLLLDKQQIEEMINSNEIYDGMTLAAWALAVRHV